MAQTSPPQFNGKQVSSEEIANPLQVKTKLERQNWPQEEKKSVNIVKVLAMLIIPLSILTTGITAYYYGSHSPEQTYTNERVDSEPSKTFLLLLLIGAGTISGTVAAFWVSRSLKSRAIKKKAAARVEVTENIKVLTSAIDKIRAGTRPEAVLTIAVTEARKAIDCDRVLFYSLSKQFQGRVIAESVAPHYPRAINAVIDDPCFKAHYLEKYQNGRVQVVNNIYEANLTPCHISQLEPFAVKANLVTPVISQGQLIGLFIAHQCSAPHTWQESEIEVIVQIAKQVGLVLDNLNLLHNSALLQQQKETEINRFQSLNNATQQIRASFSEKAVFKTAVEEARKSLNCDRVIVYSLDEQSQSQVIAESVDSLYPPSLNAVIDDPCFNSFYINKYQNGRVKATNDVYKAGLTACHLAQLEPFAIKANLVTPIINQGKIFGLLIAHQCRAPYVWQESEINVMMQIANQTGATIDYIKQLVSADNLKQEKETEVKRVHSLTNAVEKIRASLKPEDIFPTAVEEARKSIAADRVVVYSLDEQSQGRVIAESVDSRYPPSLNAVIDDPCFSNFYIEKYQNGRVRAIDDVYQGNLTPCHLAQLELFAVKANLVTPIIHQNKLIGLLIAHHCRASHTWQSTEIKVMVQIARQIGFTMESFKLLNEVAQVSQALMEQIPAVADFAQVAIANAQQAQIQVQQTSQTIKAGCEVANQTVDDLAGIQNNIAQTVHKIKYLGQSSQKISQLVVVIDNLARQINIQGMNMLIRAGKTGNPADGSRTAPLAETMESLRTDLAAATAEIQSFVGKIEIEVDELSTTMKAKTEKVIKGADLAEETRQKLNQIDTVTSKMSLLLGNIINAAAKGVQTSAGTSQAIVSNAHLLPEDSSQPQVVSASLNKLLETYLQVENSLPSHQEYSQNSEDERSTSS